MKKKGGPELGEGSRAGEVWSGSVIDGGVSLR